MGQSLCRNIVHIVFSTKYRQPFIVESVEQELFSYIGGICNNLGCKPIIVGGYGNHVHILCILSKRIPLMKLLEKVKANSSRWIKGKGVRFRNFYWQEGYAAFSVWPSDVATVVHYIATQEIHHRRIDYKTEYREYLDRHEIEYDEKYIWD